MKFRDVDPELWLLIALAGFVVAIFIGLAVFADMTLRRWVILGAGIILGCLVSMARRR